MKGLMKRRLVMAVAIILGISILASGWVVSAMGSDSEPTLSLPDAIQVDFGTRYGTDKSLLTLTEAQEMYVLVWEDAENRYATLWLDGLWVELMNVPLVSGTTSPTPAPTPPIVLPTP